MNILNLSDKYTSEIYKHIPRNLNIKKIVIMPDFTPLTGNISTGTTVLINNIDWRKYAISDIGCGISLYETDLYKKDFNTNMWDELFHKMKEIKRGNYGSLGSGNHFLDAMIRQSDNKLFIAIHTGSPFFKEDLHKLIDNPSQFDKTYTEIIESAIQNRIEISKIVISVIGNMNLIVDKVHNAVEKVEEGIIIRKGCVKINPDEVTLIPSSMTGNAVLVKATEKIKDALYSLSHGTGRLFSVSESKTLYTEKDFDDLRNSIYIPKEIPNDSFKGEVPEAYRTLEDVLDKLKNYIEPVYTLKPIAYIGQL